MFATNTKVRVVPNQPCINYDSRGAVHADTEDVEEVYKQNEELFLKKEVELTRLLDKVRVVDNCLLIVGGAWWSTIGLA